MERGSDFLCTIVQLTTEGVKRFLKVTVNMFDENNKDKDYTDSSRNVLLWLL